MVTHLGEREEALGDGDDILHLLNRLDAVLDDLGMLGAGRVQDVLDAVDVTLRPVAVRLLHGLLNGGVSSLAHGITVVNGRSS